MKKLFFLVADHASLLAAGQFIAEPAAQAWRWRLLSDNTNIAPPSIPVLSAVERSDLLGLTWRGLFWGGGLSVLLVVVLWPLTRGVDEALHGVLVFVLPVVLICFGGWLGGLLGLMSSNPIYREFNDYLAAGQQLLVVECREEHERLLRREMASLGLLLLASRERYCWSYRYPQNYLSRRAPL